MVFANDLYLNPADVTVRIKNGYWNSLLKYPSIYAPSYDSANYDSTTSITAKAKYIFESTSTILTNYWNGSTAMSGNYAISAVSTDDDVTGNYDYTVPGTWTNIPWAVYRVSKKDVLREKIRRQLAPDIFVRRPEIWGVELTPEERRARTLLCELVGEKAFVRYVKKGFLMVRGKTGILYKISGGHCKIETFLPQAGGGYKPYESICIVFKEYSLPFTDGVVMRLLLIQNDEFGMRRMANVSYVNGATEASLQYERRVGESCVLAERNRRAS
jgi:hypothetical protein